MTSLAADDTATAARRESPKSRGRWPRFTREMGDRIQSRGTNGRRRFRTSDLPGKEEMDRDAFEEMRGSRHEEYEEARRSAGIRREAVWHQETPQGTLAVVYIEADDVGAAMQAIGTSEAPFDRCFATR